MTPPRRRPAGLRGLGAAVALHLAVVGVVRFPGIGRRHGAEPEAPVASALAGDEAPVTPDDGSVVVVLADDAILGALPELRIGLADDFAQGQGHPLPLARLDSPGRLAATPAAPGAGGPVRVTVRHDARALALEAWNHPDRYQQFQRDRARSATPESLIRRPRPRFDEIEARRRRAASGVTETPATEAGGALAAALDPRPWRDLDPRFDARPPQPAARARDGDALPRPTRLMAEAGAIATEAPRRGPTGDELDAAAYSDALQAHAIEFARPRAGAADGEATRGAAGTGLARRSDSRHGTAATARDAEGGERAGVRAERQDPYFRRMYERVDRLIEYPRELALSLDQGEVVVAFTLLADGRMEDLRVVTPSGFGQFDREIVRAMRAAAPFGPLPAALLRRSGGRLLVEAPFAFEHPIVR